MVFLKTGTLDRSICSNRIQKTPAATGGACERATSRHAGCSTAGPACERATSRHAGCSTAGPAQQGILPTCKVPRFGPGFWLTAMHRFPRENCLRSLLVYRRVCNMCWWRLHMPYLKYPLAWMENLDMRQTKGSLMFNWVWHNPIDHRTLSLSPSLYYVFLSLSLSVLRRPCCTWKPS